MADQPNECRQRVRRDPRSRWPDFKYCGRKTVEGDKCGMHSASAKAKRKDKSEAAYALKRIKEDIGTLREAAVLLERRHLGSLAERVDEAAARWKEEMESGP